MISKQKKQLSQKFYNKICYLIGKSKQSHQQLIWNEQGNGIQITNCQDFQKILISYLEIHLRTFRKMLKLYGFKRNYNDTKFTHHNLQKCKLTTPQSQFPAAEQRQIKVRIKQQEQISIEQKIKSNQPNLSQSILKFTKNIVQTIQKKQCLSVILKQRCNANQKILDSLMFKLLTRTYESSTEKQKMLQQINKIKESLRKNQSDINNALQHVQKTFIEEREIGSMLKQEIKQDQIHYLTLPNIQSLQHLKDSRNYYD